MFQRAPRLLAPALTALAVALAPVPALADELHMGDIFPGLSGSQLTILNGQPTLVPGGRLFEGDFRDFALGDNKTDDPGYDAPAGTFAAGTIIGYRGIDVLKYWDGSAWTAAVGGITVGVSNAVGGTTIFSGTGITDPAGAIGQVVAGEELHEHLDMELFGLAPTTDTAFLLGFRLTSQTASGGPGPYAESLPYFIALNYGLDEEAFEGAVEQLLTPIPEPGTYALLIAGLLGLAAVARRRSA